MAISETDYKSIAARLPCREHNLQLSEIAADIAEVKADLKEVKKILIGNGEVKDSIAFRLTQTEETVGKVRSFSYWLLGTIGAVVVPAMVYGAWQLLKG